MKFRIKNIEFNAGDLPEIIIELRGFWQTISYFYLFAYLYWIYEEGLSFVEMVQLFLITAIPGVGLVIFAFTWFILLIAREHPDPGFPIIRGAIQVWAAIMLLSWTRVYLNAQGRIVAHWSLDLLITIVGPIILLYFTFKKPVNLYEKYFKKS